MDEKVMLEALKSIYENAAMPFAVLSRGFDLKYANKALLEIYPDIENPITFYELFCAMNFDALENRLNAQKSCELVCSVGEKKNVHILFTAIGDDEIRYVTLTSTFKEYPENAEEVLNLSPVQVSRQFQDRIITMFSAIYAMSHTNDIDNLPMVCEYLNLLNQSCYNLLRSADNIVKLLMLREHSDTINIKSVDLRHIVDKVYETVIAVGNKNCVPICFECDENIVPVYADLSRFEFVLSNVLLNSFKYTKPDNKIKITLKSTEKNAVLTVSDNGAGIPREILSKIGEKAIPQNDNNFDAGLGLGLLISKEYMLSMGGSLSIVSEEGVGTSVSMSLPVYDIYSLEDIKSGNVLLESPPIFKPEENYSITKIQLSEVCFYPVL